LRQFFSRKWFSTEKREIHQAVWGKFQAVFGVFHRKRGVLALAAVENEKVSHREKVFHRGFSGKRNFGGKRVTDGRLSSIDFARGRAGDISNKAWFNLGEREV